MGKIKFEGIILYKTKFKNTSYILDVFTKSKGRIPLIARGALRDKSKFLGDLEFLNHLYLYVYFKNSRNINTLMETEMIEDSNFIITNPLIFNKLGEIVYHLRRTLLQGEKHDKIYDKFILMLKGIKKNKPYKAILYFFYFYLKFIGWDIKLTIECSCNNPVEDLNYFDYENGEFYCSNCKRGDKINNKIVLIIKQLLSPKSKELNISKKEFLDCYNLLLKYLKYHIS